MATHLTADSKKIVRKVNLYLKDQLDIPSLYDNNIWRLAFFLSLKTRQANLEEFEAINYKDKVTTEYEALFNAQERYLIINMLSIVHNRKIDIHSEEPAKLVEKHCRHGFKILEEKFNGIDISVVDFFLHELPNLQVQTYDETDNLEELLIKERDELAEKLYTAFLETKIAVKYLGQRHFQRNTKYYFEVKDLNHNREIVDDITKKNLELQTGLHHKLYLANTPRERTFSVNIMKEQIEPHHIEEYAFETATDDLSLIIGLDDEDRIFRVKLPDLPHLLVSGTTGSGKTVFLRTLIYQLIQKNIDLMLIDPKGGQAFNRFEDQERTLLITDVRKADEVISELVDEMERRYQNKTLRKSNPIVLLIDEFSDLLMQNKKLEELIIRLAQKGREANIFLILATQRPDSKILEGALRSNLPSRIAFKVQKSTESKIILDEIGAENLQNKGEMLFNNQKQTRRLQAFYMDH